MGPGQLACAATLLLLLSVGPDRCICGECRVSVKPELDLQAGRPNDCRFTLR